MEYHMNDNEPVHYMLADLQSRYNHLLSDFNKLKDLQQQIELLRSQANSDSKARETLLRLDTAFPNGLKQEKAKMAGCISQMKMQFKQLETQLININPDEGV
jgi:secretion system chaperone SseA